MSNSSKTKLCPGCHKPFSLYSERCPHCGKDSSVGTQRLGLLVTLGMLMIAPILIMILVFIFW